MKKTMISAVILALCLSLSACGSSAPSLEEVEAAIQDGSVTIQDALDKGWITQEWVDEYYEKNSVPAADKMEINAVGEFETEAVSGETFTREDLPPVAFLAFIDPAAEDAEEFYQGLVDAADGVSSAGGAIIVCSKGDLEAEVFQDAPFTVVAYNDSMKEALAQNDEMASGSPCTGVWYGNGSILSAWLMKIDAEDLVESAGSFVEMTEEQEEDTNGQDEMSAIVMG